ncbi:hypothetical protein CDD81_4189 [Ophiocordyceps australis]|uniref:2EXR domain-containing protein n=1 Tax=Ophiocordyceps australis TaxID=1399860 RepID=A0A2C5XJ74_9HYPO|nr:hypothetical protein CDD81_4189 [Ophiocordyceps australis]
MDAAMEQLGHKFSQLSTFWQPIELPIKRKHDGTIIDHRPTKRARFMEPEFKYFSKLPPELQMTIWEMAAPKDRLVALFKDNENHDREDKVSTTANTPFFWLKSAPKERTGMDAACFQSRNTLQKIGFVPSGALGCRSRTKELYNPWGDIFLLDLHYTNSALIKLNLRGIERLAIYCVKFKDILLCCNLLDNIIRHAPRCREITFVYCDTVCLESTGGVPRNEKLHLNFLPHTQEVGCYNYPYLTDKWNLNHDSPATWQQVKEAIEATWKNKAISESIPLSKIPTLVGGQLDHNYEMFSENPWRRSLVRDV